MKIITLLFLFVLSISGNSQTTTELALKPQWNIHANAVLVEFRDLKGGLGVAKAISDKSLFQISAFYNPVMYYNNRKYYSDGINLNFGILHFMDNLRNQKGFFIGANLFTEYNNVNITKYLTFPSYLDRFKYYKKYGVLNIRTLDYGITFKSGIRLMKINKNVFIQPAMLFNIYSRKLIYAGPESISFKSEFSSFVRHSFGLELSLGLVKYKKIKNRTKIDSSSDTRNSY